MGVELDAVDIAEAPSDGLFRPGKPADRRVAVHLGPARGVDERFHHVRRRPHLGVAAAEIDERRPVLAGRRGDTAEERDEVLLWEPGEAGGPGAHPVIVFAPLVDARRRAPVGAVLLNRCAAARSTLGRVNLVEALAVGVGPRPAGSPAAGRAAELVADAFRDLGLEPRFQEFELLGYEADEPELEVEGERWDAGPCMYAHAFDGEGTVRRIGSTP